jgi:hypothetical protein
MFYKVLSNIKDFWGFIRADIIKKHASDPPVPDTDNFAS